LTLEAPSLWSAETPCLYRLTTELIHDGETIDEVETPFGVRSVAFDSEKGFLLNGRQTKLRGVCNHHDAGPLGAAVPDKILETRLRQLKAMGCNAIRTSHNPFAPEFYDLCDRLGILVMDEIFDGWHRKAEFDYGGEHFAEWWRRDLEDFIRRDRNHPCVVVWSIGNETGDMDKHGMTELIHGLDPTREVTGGEVHEGVDVRGYNGRSEPPGALEQEREQAPDGKFVLTEVPHTYHTRSFYRVKTWYRDFKRPRHDVPDAAEVEIFFDDWAPNHPHTVCYNSCYDNATVRICCRHSWERTRDTDWVAGEFRWTGFDYLGESFGWPFRSGNNGLLDLCGFEKDHYYFYQSQWTCEPMVHLLPHWTHPGKEGVTIPVWAWSNCDSVELFLNGQSLGVRRPGRRWQEMQCAWDVPYEPGEIRAIGRKDGAVAAEHFQVTAGDPARLLLTLEGSPLGESVPDLAAVSAAATDGAGNFHPRGSSRVAFAVQGPAHLRALGNGDPADLGPHTLDSRRAFHGLCKAFVESDGRPGAIRLVAAAALGPRFFRERATIALDVAAVMLRGDLPEPEAEVFFTTDGSEPSRGSQKHVEPFEIDGTTTIRALICVGDMELRLEERFTKGDELTSIGQDREALFPVSERLFGRWSCEDRARFGQDLDFRPDGRVEFIGGDEAVDAYSWWYEEPIDPFEMPEADKGRLVRNWDEWGLNLLAPGRLRVTMAARAGGEQLVFVPQA